jgi:hypothetical protein
MWDAVSAIATAVGSCVTILVFVWGLNRSRRKANEKSFTDLKTSFQTALDAQTTTFNEKLSTFVSDCETASNNVLAQVVKLDRDLEDVRKQVRAFEGETITRFADRDDVTEMRQAIRVIDGKVDSINEYLREPRRAI